MPKPLPSRALNLPWLAGTLLVGLFIWFFWPTVLGTHSFAFRDAADHYYPLFAWMTREWSAGRVPLWNPQENGGVPVVGDATSGVFYPGQLVFALPVRFAARYNAYVTLHVILAAAAAYSLARGLGRSRSAATLAAISYAYCGTVLFQACNVVFLVGAAWLPWAVLASWQVLRHGSRRAAVWLAVVLALMVLGGDPQMAYNALLVAGVGCLFRRQAAPATVSESAAVVMATRPRDESQSTVRRSHRVCLLTASACAAACLSAVQVLPAWRAARDSERALFAAPRSLYEIPAYLGREASASTADRQGRSARPGIREVLRGLGGWPVSETHHEQMYRFSIGPWRLGELIWPNVSGRIYPTYRRWLDALPAEGLVWSPSLYAGMLPTVLALAAVRFGRGPVVVRWLSWCGIGGLVASFGWYGLGFWWHELLGLLGVDPQTSRFGPPTGGLYWAMVVFLPGYSEFRYPAKLMVVFSLALSVLAGFGWDQRRAAPWRALRILAAVVLLTGFAMLVALALREEFTTLALPPDVIYGPFEGHAAWWALVGSLGHALAVALVGGWLLLTARRAAHRSIVLLALTTLDLAVAQRELLPLAEAAIWEQPSRASQLLVEADPAGRCYWRPAGRGWVPARWSRESALRRPAERLAWDRDTLYPRWGLGFPAASLESPATLMPADWQLLLDAARRRSQISVEGSALPCAAVLDALGADGWLVPAPWQEHSPGWPPSAELVAEDFRHIRRVTTFPRAWIVHAAVQVPPVDRRDPRQLGEWLDRVYFPHGAPRDLRREAVVEEVVPMREALATPSAAAPEDVLRLVEAGPQRLVWDVSLARPGLFVIRDRYDGEWQAQVWSEDLREGRVVPLLRANGVMRAVPLATGPSRVVLTYRPLTLYAGGLVSGAAWLVVLGWFLGRTLFRQPAARTLSGTARIQI